MTDIDMRAVADDFALERFPTAHGPELKYRDYSPHGSEETAAPVLCLPGLTRNAKDFEELAPRIAATGRRVLAPDLRGRGLSDPDPDPSRYLPETYAVDMIDLLDALEVPRVVIVGTSLGAIMAMLMARHRPELVAGAVLNDLGAEVDAEGLKRVEAHMAAPRPRFASWEEAAAAFQSVAQPIFPRETGEAFWLAFVRRVMREEPDGGISPDYDPAIAEQVLAGRAVPATLSEAFEALRRKPTLVVRGALSDLLTPEILERMRARKPDLQVVEAEDVGHAPYMTENDVWPTVEAFLSTLR